MSLNYINDIGVSVFLVIIGVLAFKYVKYWQQLQMALKDEKDRLKMYSQKEINVVTNNDIKAGYDIILSNTGTAAKIIFSLKTGDPKVLAPLKGIRRVILLFCITPLIFAISFTFINALLS